MADSPDVPGREAGVADAIAVVVVHGVADQQRGETANAVSAQIASLVDATVKQVDCTVTVVPVDPALKYPEEPGPDWQARFRKSFEQSMRSDFIASGEDRVAPAARGGTGLDLDCRFSDYLFWKARNGTSDPAPAAEPHPHQAATFEVRGGPRRIDVVEMYWGDLSRLGGDAPRILTELFTLLFNLSRLGAGAVALGATLNPENRGLHWLSKVQRFADWTYSRVFATAILQLTLCAGLLFVATMTPKNLRLLAIGLAIAVPVGIVLYGVLRDGWRRIGVVVIIGAAAEALLVWSLFADFLGVGPCLVMVWLIVVLGVQERLFDFWERRFRGVYLCGVIAASITFLCGLWGVFTHGGPALAHAWAAGALRAADIMFGIVLLTWCVLPPVLVAVVVCGTWATAAAPAGPVRDRIGRTVATGRFGLLLSLGAFTAFSMTLWAIINKPVLSMVMAADLRYQSLAYDTYPNFLRAAEFLKERYADGTVTFYPVAFCVVLLVIQLILTLLPSAVIELRLLRSNAPQRVREWLTHGYDFFDRSLGTWAYLVAAVFLVGTTFNVYRIVLRGMGTESSLLVAKIYETLLWESTQGLSWIVILLVGATTGLIATGRVAWKWLQQLRGPLDIALDVDNHFREFPRRAIPRVTIFERYIAILEDVVARKYRRIVIVAHSQGTVITAELLRYLQQRANLALPPGSDRLADLGRALQAADVSLLTVGSPLRQLYARRFPDVYQWVVADLGNGTTGPGVTELGVKRWLNRWGTADYVGRWLWEPSGTPPDVDENIGAEAHTHYFETDQLKVVQAMRSLTS